MGKRNRNQSKILVLLKDIAATSVGNVSWKYIFDVISLEMEIDNWMTVRNALQVLIDEGVYTRTENLYLEEYIIDKGKV